MKFSASAMSAVVAIGLTSMANAVATAVERPSQPGRSDARQSAQMSEATPSYELPVVVRGVRPASEEFLPTVVVSAVRNTDEAGRLLRVVAVMGLFAAVLWRMRRRQPA